MSTLEKAFPYAINDVLAAMNFAEKCIKGKDARLINPHSKFNNRIGKIESVIPDHRHGLCALLMIYKLGNNPIKEYLNSKPDTRTYWPFHMLELIE